MQLTGTLFADSSALFGNEISTFPDYPAEIRAPQGTVSGVSGFQVHIGSIEINTPGDFCDVLVAMNPAALMANAKWAKPTATIILDEDAFDEKGIQKAGFKTMNPIEELGIGDRNIIVSPITTLTKESLTRPYIRVSGAQVQEETGSYRHQQESPQGRLQLRLQYSRYSQHLLCAARQAGERHIPQYQR